MPQGCSKSFHYVLCSLTEKLGKLLAKLLEIYYRDQELKKILLFEVSSNIMFVEYILVFVAEITSLQKYRESEAATAEPVRKHPLLAKR